MKINREEAGKKLQRMCKAGMAPDCFLCHKAMKYGDDFEIIGKRWMHRRCFKKEYVKGRQH